MFLPQSRQGRFRSPDITPANWFASQHAKRIQQGDIAVARHGTLGNWWIKHDPQKCEAVDQEGNA